MKIIGSAFKQRARIHGIQARNILGSDAEQLPREVVILALCSLCMMMSFGMTFPTFAHLFQKASSGVALLSSMVLVPQVTLFVLAPLVGNLADRYGRYPLLILTFAGLVLTNVGDIWVRAPGAYIGIQICQSIVCVGARPAMMGILADISREQNYTRHLSLVMTGFAGGLTLGPVCGGVLLQRWGVVAPFGLSACLSFVMLCLICTAMPRIASHRFHQQAESRQLLYKRIFVANMRFPLLLPLSCFISLLVLDFVLSFGRTFVEPQLVLYITKVLRFSPGQLGLLLSSHGLAMSIGTMLSSRLDSHVSKRIVVAGGFLMQALFPFSLIFAHQFFFLLLIALCSGIGGGLVLPLLGACYLASAGAEHQARISGIKEAVGAFGGILGSLPALFLGHWLHPSLLFMIGGCITIGGGLFALNAMKAYRMFPRLSEKFAASRLLSPVPYSAGVEQVVAE